MFTIRSNEIKISREQITFEKLRKKLRIVAISDVHAPCYYSSSIDLVQIINAEAPDIFVIVGDTIDRRGNEHLVGMFSGVEARYSKLAVLGNWEYQGSIDLKKLQREYEHAGISLIVNKAVHIAGFRIYGLDDSLEGSPDFNRIDQVSYNERPLLVLSHCPQSFDRISESLRTPSITISGHTHGGQIAPFGKVLVRPKGSGNYKKGWYHKNKHSMYVMKGIGTNGVPLRIGAKPELLLLDIGDMEN